MVMGIDVILELIKPQIVPFPVHEMCQDAGIEERDECRLNDELGCYTKTDKE